MASLSMNQVLTAVDQHLDRGPAAGHLACWWSGAGILGAVTLEEFSIALLVGMLVGRLLVDLRRRPDRRVPQGARAPQPAPIRARVEPARVDQLAIAAEPMPGADDEATPRPADVDADVEADDADVAGGTAIDARGPTARRPSPGHAAADRPTRAGPAGAIPPRPRKKGKRR